MEKYYFKTGGYDNSSCVEYCNKKDDGTMIGSVACQMCRFCQGFEQPNKHTGNVSWILCRKLDEARNESTPNT